MKITESKLIVFGATWCSPCASLSILLEDIEHEKFDVEEHAQLAQEYGVRSVPTLFIVDENGEVLKSRVGGINRAQLQEFLR